MKDLQITFKRITELPTNQIWSIYCATLIEMGKGANIRHYLGRARMIEILRENHDYLSIPASVYDYGF